MKNTSTKANLKKIPTKDSPPSVNSSIFNLLLFTSIIAIGLAIMLSIKIKQLQDLLSVEPETVTIKEYLPNPETKKNNDYDYNWENVQNYDYDGWKTFILPSLRVSIDLPPELLSKGFVLVGEQIKDFDGDGQEYTQGKVLTALSIMKGKTEIEGTYFQIMTSTNDLTAETDAFGLYINSFDNRDGNFYIYEDYQLPTHEENKLIKDNILRLVTFSDRLGTSQWPQAKNPIDQTYAIVNTDPNYKFPGFTVYSEIDDQVTQDVFDQILNSIQPF